MKIATFIIALCLALSLYSQEDSSAPVITAPGPEIPNPLELSSRWWEYFNVDLETFPQRMEAFNNNLSSIVENAPEDKREKLVKILRRIKSNLNAYLVARSHPEEDLPPLTPIQNQYRVSDIIQLNREIRNREILLQTDRDDLEERRRQISSGQLRLREMTQTYNAAKPRSPEKLEQGLQLINFTISLELAEEKEKRLKRAIEVDEEFLKRERRELEEARRRVMSDIEELQAAEQRLDESKSRLEKKGDALREQEASSLTLFDFSQRSEAAKLNNQILDQQLTLAAIELALARNQHILNQMTLEIVQYLNFRTETEYRDLDVKLADWKDELNRLQQNLKEWEISIRRDIQRAQEWLSINVEVSEQSEPENVKRLQEEILAASEESLVLLNQLINEVQDTEFLLGIIEQAIIKRKTGFAVFFRQISIQIATTFRTISAWLGQPLFRVGKTIVDLWSILYFFLVILISIWLARLLKVALKRFALKRKGVRLSLLYRVSRLFQYLIIALGIVLALTVLGFDFTNLVLIAGALGVGLGFGLQSIFNNFVSGIVILFENQLKVGDYIELESGVLGEVKEINVRSTYIKTNDGIAVMVPNSELTTGRVTNWTHKEPFRRVRINFGVAYGSDKELVKRVVKEAVMKVPITLKKSWVPEPRIFMDEMGPSSLNFTAMVWVDDAATKRSAYTRSQYLWAIHDALIENDIAIPFPQLDLHVKNMMEYKNFKEMMDSMRESDS